jgi:hypothetical protein
LVDAQKGTYDGIVGFFINFYMVLVVQIAFGG